LLNLKFDRNNSKRYIVHFISWYNIGTTYWKISLFRHQFEKTNTVWTIFWYQSDKKTIYSIPDFIVEAFKSPLITYDANIFPIVLSLTWYNNGKFFSTAYTSNCLLNLFHNTLQLKKVTFYTWIHAAFSFIISIFQIL
jgi:hypothetical protein